MSGLPRVAETARLGALGVLAMVVGVAAGFTTVAVALAVVVLALLTLWRPAWGVAALFVVVSPRGLDNPGWSFLGDSTIRFWELALGVVLCACVVRIGRRSDLRPLVAGGPLVVALALSGLWHIETYKVLPHLLRESAPVIAVFLAWNAAREPGSGRAIRSALAVGAVLYGGLAVVEFLGQPGRVDSVFYTASLLGAYVALLAPFAAARIGVVRGAPLAGWGAVLALLLVAEVLSLSRGPALAFLIALAAVGALALLPSRRREPSLPGSTVRHQRRTAIAVAAVSITFLLVVGLLLRAPTSAPGPVAPETPDQADRLTPSSSARQFQALRLPYWRMGWEIWRDHPWLGVGPGRYGIVVREYEHRLPELGHRPAAYPDEATRRPYRSHVHMGYLQVAIGFGVVGLAGYLLFVGWLARRLWARSRASWWALGGIGALAGLVAHNLVDVTFIPLAVEWGLLLGFAAAPPRARRGARSRDPSVAPGR